MVAAMRAASRTTDGDAPVSASGDQGSAGVAALIGLQRPDLDQARMSCAIGDVADGLACRRQSRRTFRIGKDAVDAASSGSTERNDNVSGTRRQFIFARPARCSNSLPAVANMAGAAPWKL